MASMAFNRSQPTVPMGGFLVVRSSIQSNLYRAV
jgi:hypothetical protein